MAWVAPSTCVSRLEQQAIDQRVESEKTERQRAMPNKTPAEIDEYVRRRMQDMKKQFRHACSQPLNRNDFIILKSLKTIGWKDDWLTKEVSAMLETKTGVSRIRGVPKIILAKAHMTARRNSPW